MLSPTLWESDFWLCCKIGLASGLMVDKKEKTNVGLHSRGSRVHGAFDLVTGLLENTFLRVGLQCRVPDGKHAWHDQDGYIPTHLHGRRSLVGH